MVIIIVREEMKYITPHYITVTNCQHACAEFPIIDYKQLQWRGEAAAAAQTVVGLRLTGEERDVMSGQEHWSSVQSSPGLTSKLREENK